MSNKLLSKTVTVSSIQRILPIVQPPKQNLSIFFYLFLSIFGKIARIKYFYNLIAKTDSNCLVLLIFSTYITAVAAHLPTNT